jgi:hypothetical protein
LKASGKWGGNVTYYQAIWAEGEHDIDKMYYMELDDIKYQTRVVSVLLDGSLGYADEKVETNSAFLSEVSFDFLSNPNSPDHDEVCNEAWEVVEITKNKFEIMWKKAHEYCEKNKVKVRYLPRFN